MRLLNAIRAPQCVIALAALFLAAWSSPVLGQYTGGQGDGFAVAGTSYVVLDGHAVSSPAYTASASGGDGYSVSGRSFLKLDGQTDPTQVYTASASGGDGYAFSGRSFIRIDGITEPAQVYAGGLTGGDGYDFSRQGTRQLDSSAPALLVVYTGGSGDGYDAQGFENRLVNPNALVDVVFSGGSGDGYDKSGRIFIPLGGTDAAVAVLYTASLSGGDGYDFSRADIQPLDGVTLPSELFVSSGVGDGYDVSGASHIPVNGETAFVMAYLGAAGDGVDEAGWQFVPFNGAVLAEDPFIGGSGDGYDSKRLPFVQYLGGGEAAAAITFNGWRSSRFTEEEINAGLADPNADADRDGLVNLIEFALGGDPRVADARLFKPDIRLSNLSDLGFPALSDRYLTAIVRRNPLALDVTLRIEVSSDTAGFWGSNDTIQVDASSSVLIVRDEIGVKEAPRRIMRLRASLNP